MGGDFLEEGFGACERLGDSLAVQLHRVETETNSKQPVWLITCMRQFPAL